MLNNTTQNNVTVVVNENSNLKEDNTMMKNTMNNEAAVVIAMTKEEVEMMTKDQIRVALEAVGVEMSKTQFKNTKKAELVAMAEKYLDPSKKVEIVQYPINPLDDPEVMALDVSDDALMAPVEEKKEEITMNNNLIKRIAHDIIFQTIPNKNGKLIFDKDKDGKLVLIKGTALFYRPDKKDNPSTEYMVLGKRLWGVISKAISEVEGEDKKTFDYIQETIDKLVELDLITKNSEERTFVKLTSSDMSQDEKDQLNGLWRTNDIKTEKLEDGRIKAIAVTDNGKAVLNQLYPCYSYGATVDQMNKIYILSK